jgi:hypothetical protein
MAVARSGPARRFRSLCGGWFWRGVLCVNFAAELGWQVAALADGARRVGIHDLLPP